nr:zinc finger, CCHC-type, retrotransposon Gag domain protein [Tanacetum cinerariifolium]
MMVNTRTDADLSAAVQNALPTLLPQIRAEIREEFRTSSGPSDAGGNPPSWKAYKQAKGGDAWLITVTWADFMKLFFLQFVPRAEQERLKRKYHSICQTNTETSTEFMQCFLRLAGFLGAAAGTEEEQAKNFQWGLRRSTLNHLMCMSYTDVAQVANAARNYEILYERDDDDTERPDKRQKSGDRHQPTTQQNSHRNHGHNNNRQGSDKRGIPVMGVTRETGVSSPTDLPILVPSSPGVPMRATPTQFALRVDADTQESVVELLKDCKKNTTASTSGQADKKPGASGRVFAITEDHATKTSDELPGIPPFREVEFNIELIPGAE